MKIDFFEFENWERKAMQALQPQHDVDYVNAPLSGENAAEHDHAEIVSTFVNSALGRDVLEQLPHLKMIATRSTGYDHIDTAYCKEHAITVANVPAYGETTVAEHVFGLLLTISHNLVEAVDRTRRGSFSPEGLCGFDLEGKTLGVIGAGAIGRNVIGIAKGFNMQVIAFDLRPDEAFATEKGFEYVSLDEIYQRADIITLHVPANPKTYHMISDEQFAKMKKGVVVINTARGSIMDVRALVRAIADEKVAAAGLDVLEGEPAIREEAELLHPQFLKEYNLETLLADHVLLRLRNVVITPHSAFNTREATMRILQVTIENIRAFAEGHPQNVVVPR